MKEEDFYPEICEKFRKYLLSYLPSDAKISFSYNKSLPKMLKHIEGKLDGKSDLLNNYIPKLKLDILFGIKYPGSKKLSLALLEVKYLNQLGLSDYFQLVGYLQVAQKIKFGVLLLVLKPQSNSQLSNDLHEIARTKNLPMEWNVIFDKKNPENVNEFKTGISYYIPGNGIEWINANDLNGISSFEEFAELLSK